MKPDVEVMRKVAYSRQRVVNAASAKPSLKEDGVEEWKNDMKISASFWSRVRS